MQKPWNVVSNHFAAAFSEVMACTATHVKLKKKTVELVAVVKAVNFEMLSE